MDLIYTNANKEDIGVLHDYEFDLAFGADENDFECQVQSSSHCCEPGSFLYIEGTEYGGIVDSIHVDTETQTVTYKGRTWHGILAGKVIEPPVETVDGVMYKYDDYVVTGDANRILEELISYLGLDDIFTADSEASVVTVGKYSFRYINAYKGIREMLAAYVGKLKFEFKTDTVVLSAVYLKDYSRNEEWDASQVDFNAQKNYRVLNHLICLGSGNMKDRHVIHLFADEFGGIQPHTNTDNPVCDDDYVLDTSQQMLSGVDEVADVYDYPNAQTVENYVAMAEQPSDWADNYSKYFTLNDNDQYVNVEGVPIKVYTPLTEQPSDWADRYANYFMLTGEAYKAVEGVSGTEYKLQTARPSDWEKNYGNYYMLSGGNYVHPTGTDFTDCELLTQEPDDWKLLRKKYSKIDEEGGLVSVESSDEWEENRYYKSIPIVFAPTWSRNTYYTAQKAITAPAFVAGSFYVLEDAIAKPSFAADVFFELKYDHYAELVKGGLERLKSAYGNDSLDVALDSEAEYDIGDIVGAREEVIGISVWKPITKKIVNITNGYITISYKVGD